MRSGGWAVIAGVALSAAVTFGAAKPASAACVAPTISAKPTTGPPGTKVVVTGDAFFSVCNDGIVPGPTTPPTPDRGIRLQFVQTGQTVPLGSVDADAKGKFAKEVIVPLSATLGAGTLRAVGTSASAETAFDVTAPPTTTTRSSTTTTTTARATTTTSSTVSTTTTTEQTFPTLEPASTTTPTIKVKTSSEGRDWTGWIVLGIIGIGAGIFVVSWRILRSHPPSG
jgi:hypothetical protein